MTSTTTSIVVVNYEAGEKLLRCLRSVTDHLRAEDEIVLVDNASPTDGMAARVEVELPHVRVVRSPVNGGFGAGCNLGAREARGENLVFLNPDTVVEAGWAAALVAPLADPDVGLTTARIVLMDAPDRVNACGNTMHVTGISLCRGLGAPRAAYDAGGDVDAVSGAAFAVHRDLFFALGGFDEDLFLYMEDTDLSLRARVAGRRVVYVPDSVVHHDYVLKLTPRKMFYQERGRYVMLAKNLRVGTLAALAPALLVAEAVSWGFVATTRGARARGKLDAYAWVARNGARLWRKHRDVQKLRRARDHDVLAATTPTIDFAQGGGAVAKAAGFVLNPPLMLLRGAALAVVRW